ncbi:DNA-binding transcriptional regulator, AcrR family [Prauserella marina]|uniref:DNA-binding transcriptional regulator, AcrR family n=1 Tax=Prauserella marina TaxID=530584 RepID=A0A1G6RU17_9PSEU|nr:TetR/AcrR family transcriptional regulator [Prauserella marina]PWV77263.1 TetR family transcriptional regulator [Prauserella marina]SDD08122.1 DNA-binding transcriptional regulator, AcrR family [Prauserella marina]
MPEEQAQRKRQARGVRRMEQIADAAAEVFAEAGYAKATTNAIAARAGVSPGTLYQFFANKEAIAETLAQRYQTALRAAHEKAFDPGFASLPLPELIDRMVTPMIEVNIANPGFKALFAATDMPERLSAPTRKLHQAVVGRISEVVQTRVPALPADRVRTVAIVATQIFGALLSTVVAAPEAEREIWIGELREALLGYLDPVIGEPGTA